VAVGIAARRARHRRSRGRGLAQPSRRYHRQAHSP
jgi:hypothetical protein